MLVIIKKMFIVIFMGLLFGGCYHQQDYYISQEPVMLENVNNNNFKKYVQSDEFNTTQNLDDILYVDNMNTKFSLFGNFLSLKIAIGKNKIYIFGFNGDPMWGYRGVSEKNYKKYDLWITNIISKKDYYVSTKIINSNTGDYCENNKYFKSCNRLIVTFEPKDNGWLEYAIIKHRFNDIYKIKEMIDKYFANKKPNAPIAQ